MKLGTHMPDGERWKPIDIEVCRSKVKGKKYKFFVLFLEVVTLTFFLRSSISIGFLLSPPGMCVPSFI
jgi:type VI protein secretion system component Hcp